tara:strand:+ start:10742 stop:11959 length:1218 start_codon:yes stop_codon:yes gene_type:complete
MKVVILTETYAKNMGYMGNMLPKHLAKLGVEVHVLALALPPYYQINDFEDSYKGFINTSEMVPGKIEMIDGYALHTMAYSRVLGYMRMKGLEEKIDKLQPDVVYSLGCIGWLALQAAIAKIKFGFKLFTGSHTTASVFPLSKEKKLWGNLQMWRCLVIRFIPGRLISLMTNKCYGATSDCADIAVRFFGVQKSKIDICPLGVDTDTFRVINGSADECRRNDIRKKFGFSEGDIVCIYTGRFSHEKNPLVLAKAIAEMQRQGKPYKGLFFGNGVQKDEIEDLDGCTVHSFVPVHELGDYFRASDIGVWPTQESTSMLDAAACGLPIVVNDTVLAVERVKGNGLQYKLNDIDDMISKLLSLSSEQERKRLGTVGAQKMKAKFSWNTMAERRIADFKIAISLGEEYAK